jgi:hypothetical protein
MNADQYHEMLLQLDRLLEYFDRAGVLLSPQDLALRHQLRVLRSNVLKAESGHPFPAASFPAVIDNEGDEEITPAPWQIGYDPRQ